MAINLNNQDYKKVICACGCNTEFEARSRQHKFAPECAKRKQKERYKIWFKTNYEPKFKTGKCHICGIETDRILFCKTCAEQRNRDFARANRRALAINKNDRHKIIKDVDNDSETKKCGQVNPNEDCPRRKKNCDCPTRADLRSEAYFKECGVPPKFRNTGWTPRGTIDVPVYRTGYERKTYARESMP